MNTLQISELISKYKVTANEEEKRILNERLSDVNNVDDYKLDTLYANKGSKFRAVDLLRFFNRLDKKRNEQKKSGCDKCVDGWVNILSDYNCNMANRRFDSLFELPKEVVSCTCGSGAIRNYLNNLNASHDYYLYQILVLYDFVNYRLGNPISFDSFNPFHFFGVPGEYEKPSGYERFFLSGPIPTFELKPKIIPAVDTRQPVYEETFNKMLDFDVFSEDVPF